MAYGNIEKKVAYSIFKLAKQGGYVPPDVAAAARRVIDGTARGSDKQTIRDFKGISHTGAGAMRKQWAGMAGAVGNIGQLSTLVGTITTGGPQSLGAGLALTQRMASMAEGFAKSPAFREMMTKLLSGPRVAPVLLQKIAAMQKAKSAAIAAGQAYGGASQLAGLEAQAAATTAGMMKGTQFTNALAGGARMAGAAATVAGITTAAALTIEGMIDRAIGGKAERSDEIRKLRIAATLARLPGNRGPGGIYRDIAETRRQHAEHVANTSSYALPGGETLGEFFRGNISAQRERRLSIKAAGLEAGMNVDTAKMTALGTERALSEYGPNAGWWLGKTQQRAKWLIDASQAKAIEAINSAAAHRREGFSQAAIGNVNEAQREFAAANNDVPGSIAPALWNTANLYKSSLDAQAADHYFARTQMTPIGPHAGNARTGD